jgi:DAHL domain-containing protein
MKVTFAAVAVPVLLVLLTWLSFRAIDTDAERYDRALKALDRFAIIEIALHRDVLSARAGLLRDYDPLVREVNALRESLGRLRNNASRDAEEAAAIDRFAAAIARQEELTEQFKSDNALLQNSLAHFRLFSARLSASDEGGGLAPGVSALAAAMLPLTLDTSPMAARGRGAIERARRAKLSPPLPQSRFKRCWCMEDCFTTSFRRLTPC